jgi:3-hydroxyisobutyrate dehydrogenase-like beta-hydroxyacid dehydrogenase
VETVAVVSPGAMGSAMADALARGGARVVTTLAGRSERTGRLAGTAPLELLPDLRSVVREADVVLSIVPPEAAGAAAEDIARAAREQGVSPLLVDLNAIAPATVRALAGGELEVVDGSISGPPPWKPGTRVYLSGPRATEIAALPFEGVELIVVDDKVGSASAVKMSTASVYKGTTALLAQALRAAHANGVLEHVVADLRAAAPQLVANVDRRVAVAASKSGRYAGEMREIAATQGAAGLTPALFEAIAEIYESMAATPLARKGSERLIARIGVVLGKTLLVTGPGAGDGSPCRTRRDQLTKLREVLAVRDIASFVMSHSNGGAFRRSYREWRLTPSHRCEGVGRSELIA